MSDENTQDQPIMSGSDDATDHEKSDGRDAQERADAAFYKDHDKAKANQPDPDPAVSSYANPSSSDLSHDERSED
ncbi:MAG: hypothetical protein EPO52_13865 [Herbiconiux sp.]|uniref:hypothetical protein n=1 Tax=Herbiconiux sp. TaxID=1871186 RepID=UPI0012086023|nr:hypothetical protein [Herbiconiux sp.]TAJ46642.1 MAG: hypothetical protein EPO52_13865 [Herbiconiux sp.]